MMICNNLSCAQSIIVFTGFLYFVNVPTRANNGGDDYGDDDPRRTKQFYWYPFPRVMIKERKNA